EAAHVDQSGERRLDRDCAAVRVADDVNRLVEGDRREELVDLGAQRRPRAAPAGMGVVPDERGSLDAVTRGEALDEPGPLAGARTARMEEKDHGRHPPEGALGERWAR